MPGRKSIQSACVLAEEISAPTTANSNWVAKIAALRAEINATQAELEALARRNQQDGLWIHRIEEQQNLIDRLAKARDRLYRLARY